MSAVYDRHEYIKDLTVAGADQDLAEAIALGAVRVQESTLATKKDIGKLEKDITELKMGMAQLEASTREDIAELKMGMAELKTAMAEQEAKLEGRIGKLEGRIGKLEWMLGFNLALTAAVLLALIFR